MALKILTKDQGLDKGRIGQGPLELTRTFERNAFRCL